MVLRVSFEEAPHIAFTVAVTPVGCSPRLSLRSRIVDQRPAPFICIRLITRPGGARDENWRRAPRSKSRSGFCILNAGRTSFSLAKLSTL